MDINALYKTLNALAIKASTGMRQILTRKLVPPINMNGLISKVDLTVTKNETSVTIESHFPDYAIYTDKGRRPGKMPPEKPIKDWVVAHNIPVSAVFPIRRKIQKKGIEGKNFTEPLRRMIQLISSTCLSMTKDSVRKEVTEEFNANIKSIDVKL